MKRGRGGRERTRESEGKEEGLRGNAEGEERMRGIVRVRGMRRDWEALGRVRRMRRDWEALGRVRRD